MARLKLAGYFAAPADSATCRPGRRLLRSVHRKLALRRPQAHRNNQLKSVLPGGLQSASQSLSILIRFSRPAKCSRPRQHRAPSVCSSLLFSTLFYFILFYSTLFYSLRRYRSPVSQASRLGFFYPHPCFSMFINVMVGCYSDSLCRAIRVSSDREETPAGVQRQFKGRVGAIDRRSPAGLQSGPELGSWMARLFR